MEVHFGAGKQSGTIVIEPVKKKHDSTGDLIGYTRGLRIEYVNGYWNSEHAQKSNAWTDEERERAENAMRNHPLKGVPRRGFYIVGEEDTSAVPPASAPEPGKLLCAAVSFDPATGDPQQCPNEAAEGSDLCSEHLTAPNAAVEPEAPEPEEKEEPEAEPEAETPPDETNDEDEEVTDGP